ncbi:MAG TPA: hypothetical protein VGK26_11970 [Thermoanaerobaculia bacterium]|jgi:hypothetical protein
MEANDAKPAGDTPETTTPDAPPEPAPNEDDRRAEAAAVNRKRAEKEWEENKKRWRAMGVPKALPAKK